MGRAAGYVLEQYEEIEHLVRIFVYADKVKKVQRVMEVDCIGEEKAKQQGIEYKIGSFNVAGNGRAMIMGEALGIAKLISDADGNLIGAQLMGPRATDMIAELALALKVGASVETIAETIHPHPTVSEVIAEAAHDWEGLCCHSLPKKK